MARAGSAWSIKGIDDETRAIARSRAGDSDLTIGAWVDQAILTYSRAPRAGSPTQNNSPTKSPTPTPIQMPPSGPPADEVILDLIDQELDASRSRLDVALRPVGYALKDLALRLVAAEALERGGTPRPARPTPISATPIPPATLDTTEALSVEEPIVPRRPPAPPVGSLAPAISDMEIPAPAAPRARPEPPTQSLHPHLEGMDPPPALSAPPDLAPLDIEDPIEREETPRPAPIPPTTALAPIDPNDIPEPPRTFDRKVPAAEVVPEATPDITRPVSDPDVDVSSFAPLEDDQDRPVELGVRFQGVQAGFESNPDLAVLEARETRRLRLRRIAAGVIPLLIVGSLAGGYFFAEPLGLSPARDAATAWVSNHGRQVGKTISDAFTASQTRIAGLIGEVRTLAHESGTHPSEPDEKRVELPRVKPKAQPRPLPQSPPKAAVAVLDQSQEKPAKAPAPSPRPEAATQSSEIRAATSLTPDDPSIANLATGESGQPPVGALTGEQKASQKPETKPASKPLNLATRPPPPPVISGPTTTTSVKTPKPPTRLAALPKAPAIVDSKIPPSGTNRPISIDAVMNAARAGDPRSQHELARRYLQGDGVDQDFAEASEWFREAAIQGVANAQYNLAILYERGLGVTKDDVRALLWYHSAAEQSHPHAQYNLGIFYLQGRGIPLSYAEAARWFRAASGQGVAKATYNLAVLTEDGLGLPRDKAKAITLYKQAADAGHHEAVNRLAILRDPNAAKPKPATFEETATTQNQDLSSGTTVADIQARLRQDGIYNGRIDGIAGPKTRTAIREFQKRNDLPITGIPSEYLLDFMKSNHRSG